jgi:biopolymer transport protein ExbB
MTRALTWLIGVALVGVLAPATSGAEDLRALYQKEFAFLEAEKRALVERLRAAEADARQRASAERAVVARLEGQVIALRSEADELEAVLAEAGAGADDAADDLIRLEDLLNQAAERLESESITVPRLPALEPAGATGEPGEAAPEGAAQAPVDPVARFGPVVEGVFAGAAAAQANLSGVSKGPGAFFLADGTRVEGTLVRVGGVSTFGVAEQAAGALAPAGNDRLRLWPIESADAARAALAYVDGGARPDLPTMGVFVHETLVQAVEPRGEKTALQIIESGGVIAWVIVGLGALALLMILARAVLLLQAGAGANKLVARISIMVSRGPEGVYEARAALREPRGSTGRVLRAAVEHLDQPRDRIDDVVSEAILDETPTIERFGSAITVSAAVAPLMGLLGTVTGMIATFDVITEFGTGDPKLLSGGISEALVTTELGLIVAIPTLLIGTLLHGWAERLLAGLERAALRIVNVARGVDVSAVDDSHGTEQAPAAPAEESA